MLAEFGAHMEQESLWNSEIPPFNKARGVWLSQPQVFVLCIHGKIPIAAERTKCMELQEDGGDHYGGRRVGNGNIRNSSIPDVSLFRFRFGKFDVLLPQKVFTRSSE